MPALHGTPTPCATGSSTKASRPFCQWRQPHYKQCFTHNEPHWLKVPSTPPPTIQECYAVSHYQSISYHIQPYLQPSSVTTRGHRLRYMIPFCRTDILSRSYFLSTIRLWNQIPQKESTALPWTLSRLGLPPRSFEYP